MDVISDPAINFMDYPVLTVQIVDEPIEVARLVRCGRAVNDMPACNEHLRRHKKTRAKRSRPESAGCKWPKSMD